MWRNNALKLRRGLSAVRHGQSLRWYSSLGVASPVSELEFLQAWEEVYPRSKWRGDDSVYLAVSGGVDSMALATLYSKARLANSDLPRCYGIIIDHKIRPESTEEAKWVAHQLHSKLNIRTKILPLKWHDTSDVRGVENVDTKGPDANFETTARTLRYQALGGYCGRKYASSLLVAHHADDQAETIFMRLMDKRWRAGLQGMQPVERISECYGMHGVHESRSESPRSNSPMPIQVGGVQVLRPLLQFEKSRLIATCEDAGIAWAEDKTNQDRRLTVRNAVRHVIQDRKLPSALSKESLISLSIHMRERIACHKEMAEQLFNNCPLHLELETGSLVVRLPPADSFLDRPIVTESDKHFARNTATLFLQRIANLISPEDSSSPGRLSTGIEVIYPALRANPGSIQLHDFCVFGIWFRRWNEPSPFAPPDGPLEEHEMEWVLTRQPLPQRPEQSTKQVGTCITIPPMRTDATACRKWHLFDGRYWIRVVNHEVEPLKIRNIEAADVLLLGQDESSLTERSSRRIYALLEKIRYRQLRRVIPGIFRTDPEGRDFLIALPTFNVRSKASLLTESGFWIEYKKIDLGLRSPEEIIAKSTLTSGIELDEAMECNMKGEDDRTVARKKKAEDDTTTLREETELDMKNFEGEESQQIDETDLAEMRNLVLDQSAAEAAASIEAVVRHSSEIIVYVPWTDARAEKRRLETIVKTSVPIDESIKADLLTALRDVRKQVRLLQKEERRKKREDALEAVEEKEDEVRQVRIRKHRSGKVAVRTDAPVLEYRRWDVEIGEWVYLEDGGSEGREA